MQFGDCNYTFFLGRLMWCFEVIKSEKALIHNSLLLLDVIILVIIQRSFFCPVSDVITLIFSFMLNSTCDDSVNTNTGLKCISIDLLQLRTLWNNVINTTAESMLLKQSYQLLCENIALLYI